MFRWENHYFLDLATPTVKVTRVAPDHVVQEETPILGMTEPEMQAEIGHETCKFTSKEFKSQAINVLRLIQTGQMVDPDTEQPPPPFDVDWSNEDCTKAKKAKEAMCPHPTNWWYTINDGFLALAVQGGEVEDAEADAEGADVEQLEKLNGVKETKEQKQAREAAAKARKEAYNHPDAKAVREAVYDFHKHDKWDEVYRSAYIKMVSLYTTYSPIATARPFHINGAECPSGITMEPACAQDQEGPASSDVTTLWNGGAMCQRRVCGNQCCSIVTIIWDKVFNKKNVNCDNCCICATAVRELMYNNSNGQVERQTFATRFPGVVPAGLNTDPLPAAPNAAVPVIEHDSYEMDDHITPNIKVNGGFSDPPYSPFVDPSSVCPHTHGISVRVEGYPSSPWRWSPFTRPYAKPAIANVSRSWCKSGDSGMCVDAFEIDIFVSSVDLGCPAGRTRVLSYNGTMPGPTIRMLKGRQSLVRFNNRLTDEKVLGSKFKPHPPCSSDEGRKGRPISVHHHGEASLAPYDGWAEDSTCGGESKDYYYPNRRPGFAWYHDHQLEITSENAYYGLSGMYIVHDKGNEGGCGEPWNMDALPDLEMQLKDAVLDKQCQLYFDREDDHKENLYGDVNLVNGVPWPVMTVDPRWHRFRWVNSAVTRPFKLRIVDEHGEDVSSSACLVVAGEGGVRREPAPFPPGGLFIGVAERYEVVCDLTNHAGRTLFVWNQKDERRMKHVPFFCYSHLVSKIRVKPCPNGQSTCAPPGSAFAATAPARPALDAVLSESDIQAAQDMIRERRCTRIFKFGRRRGQWVINGETWHTMRVAAGNVGQNTWEVWCLETGGGWFHPIHIHLVDFYVLARNREFSKVHDYEKWTPKDVVQLDPSAEVALLLRFGPHRGEYMFHCHNLVHEDTEMMRSFHIKHTNVSRAAPTALPMQQHPSLIQNLNTIYDLYDDPVTPRFGARETKKLPPLTNSQSGPWVQFPVTNGIYRIFYPGGAPGEDPRLSDPSVNPWRVNTCQLQRPRP